MNTKPIIIVPLRVKISRNDGRKIAAGASRARTRWAGPATAPRKAEEGEEWAGHGLGRAIAGQELAIADPARVNDGRVEQRQNDVAATENEGAGPIEGIEQTRPADPDSAHDRKADEQGRRRARRRGRSESRSDWALVR